MVATVFFPVAVLIAALALVGYFAIVVIDLVFVASLTLLTVSGGLAKIEVVEVF